MGCCLGLDGMVLGGVVIRGALRLGVPGRGGDSFKARQRVYLPIALGSGIALGLGQSGVVAIPHEVAGQTRGDESARCVVAVDLDAGVYPLVAAVAVAVSMSAANTAVVRLNGVRR